jgi:hypothetical protein
VNPFTWFTFTGNQSETYTVLTNAAYTYTQTQDYADPVILTADDPRFGGHTKLKITYNDHVWAPNGFIQTEINPVSGATISALTNEMVTFANGGVSDYRFQGYWGADPGSQPSLRVDSFAQTNAWFYDNTTTGFLSMSRRVGCPPFRVSQRPGTLMRGHRTGAVRFEAILRVQDRRSTAHDPLEERGGGGGGRKKRKWVQ